MEKERIDTVTTFRSDSDGAILTLSAKRCGPYSLIVIGVLTAGLAVGLLRGSDELACGFYLYLVVLVPAVIVIAWPTPRIVLSPQEIVVMDVFCSQRVRVDEILRIDEVRDEDARLGFRITQKNGKRGPRWGGPWIHSSQDLDEVFRIFAERFPSIHLSRRA